MEALEPPASGADDVGQARAALMAGGCVGIPTDTVYGLAARLDDQAAVAALFEIKGRAATKAMAVLVSSAADARRLGVFDDLASRIVDACWPGPLTVVVRRRREVTVDLGGDVGTIGVRCPDNDLVRELAHAVGPLVTTSANRSGEPTLETAQDIAQAFGAWLACVVDGGRLSQAASTVVDLSTAELRVLRRGLISEARLQEIAAAPRS